jgi:hypothetical protein
MMKKKLEERAAVLIVHDGSEATYKILAVLLRVLERPAVDEFSHPSGLGSCRSVQVGKLGFARKPRLFAFSLNIVKDAQVWHPQSVRVQTSEVCPAWIMPRPRCVELPTMFGS